MAVSDIVSKSFFKIQPTDSLEMINSPLVLLSLEGLFAYTSGCLVVIEDLHSGTQRHLMGHTEEISTLALQHDGLILASSSGPSDTVASQIRVWNLKDGVCKKVCN